MAAAVDGAEQKQKAPIAGLLGSHQTHILMITVINTTLESQGYSPSQQLIGGEPAIFRV
jgi:hypothetical protein